jgi:hypothetical protein
MYLMREYIQKNSGILFHAYLRNTNIHSNIRIHAVKTRHLCTSTNPRHTATQSVVQNRLDTIHTHTYIHTYTHTCIHTHMHMYRLPPRALPRIAWTPHSAKCARQKTDSAWRMTNGKLLWSRCVCARVCVCVCVCVCLCLCV